MDVQEIKQKRDVFFQKICEKTEGIRYRSVSMWQLGKELNFSRDDTSRIVDYLANEGLIEVLGMGGAIGISHEGIKNMEFSLNKEDKVKPNDSGNTFIIGQMNNSNIQHAIGQSNKQEIKTHNSSDSKEDKKLRGYAAGGFCILISIILEYLAFTNTNWIIAIIGFAFGALGIASFIWPLSAGQIANNIIQNISRNSKV